MKVNRLGVYANCDMATIAWMTQSPIPGCRGFAIERDVKGPKGDAPKGFINTWVGFKGGEHQPGESRPSTEWPIQRYLWSDYVVSFGQEVRYRVIPMVGPAAHLQKASEEQWSDWSDWVKVDTGKTQGFHAYFNRGIVPSQFMARQAGNLKQFHAMLGQDIQKPGNKIRSFLSGTLRTHLLELLANAKQDGIEIYAALYELNDPELVAALKKLGTKCSLVLGSGAYKAANKKKGTAAVPDENKKSRQDLKKNSKVHVFDRLVKSPHFAHNKFVVFCNKSGQPEKVWTGSTNWTVTGLCTQTNNGILIDDANIAKAYRQRWDELKNAKASYPKNLSQDGSKPAVHSLNGVPIRAWNVPCLKYVDLKDAKQYIDGAKQAVFYLMFNPGKGDGKKKAKALIQDILALDANKIFIEGVLNQDPGGKQDPMVQLTHKGQTLDPVPLPAILPKNLQSAGRNWFKSTFMYNMVMIHSKIMVIDPLGKNPVVMTGSHNMGPKASLSNDDNMVIIEGASGLATEYAVYIANVYGHYKWMFDEYLRTHGATDAQKKASPQYDGNQDNDIWQHWYLDGPNRRQIELWLGSGAQPKRAPRRSRAGRGSRRTKRG